MHYISGCGLFLAIMVILYQANPVWSDDMYQQGQQGGGLGVVSGRPLRNSDAMVCRAE